MKALIFDMDGTIANLYGVDGWLEDLQSENSRPYTVAKPMYNMDKLNAILEVLKNEGWRIIITSWLAKDSTRTYDTQVRWAKKEWLDRYSFPYDELHFLKYGTTKASATRRLGGYQILIDDNENIRKGWSLGSTIDANKDIIEKLIELLED